MLVSADPVNPGSVLTTMRLSRASQVFLAEVAKTLDSAPPAVPEPGERALALRLLMPCAAHALAEPAIRAGVFHARMGGDQTDRGNARGEGMQI